MSHTIPQSVLQKELSECLDFILHSLPPRDEKVLRARFFDGVTQREIGKRLGVTPARIHIIEKNALRKLSHPKRLNRLRIMLGI